MTLIGFDGDDEQAIFDEYDKAHERAADLRDDFEKYLRAMGVAESSETIEADDDAPEEAVAFRRWACGCRMTVKMIRLPFEATHPKPCERHRRAVLGD